MDLVRRGAVLLGGRRLVKGRFYPANGRARRSFEESGDAFSFKFVSVLSDRRYFGHVTVTDHGRASELSLYEGPVDGSSADRELSQHAADKVTTTRTTEFGFESKIAKDFVAQFRR